MNASHICLTCRRRLSQVRSGRLLQWQPKATFISLSTPPRTTADDRSKDGVCQSREKNAIEGNNRRSPPWKQGKKKYPGFSDEAGDVLESLFEESVKLPVASAQNSSPQLKHLEPYKNADTLNRMLDEDKHHIPEAWKFFVEHFGSEAWEKGYIEHKSCPSYLKHTTRKLLRGIIQSKKEDPLSTKLPTVTELTRVYAGLGVLKGSDWVELVFGLLDTLSRALKSDLPDYTSETDERLILDLLGAWNIMCRRLGTSVREIPTGPNFNWHYVPFLHNKEIGEAYKRRGIQHAFGLLFPQIPIHELKGAPVAALATFGHLNNESRIDSGAAAGAERLMSALARIIKVCEYDSTLIKATQHFPASVAGFIKDEWPVMKKLATEMPESPDDQTSSSPYKEVPGSQAPVAHNSTLPRMDVSFINKRLYDAILRKDLRTVESLWDDVKQWPIRKESDSVPPRGIMTEKLCNYFVLAYVGLNQPDGAIDVWNHMITKGIPPTLETWDSMLNGCRNSKNWRALEDIWLKMKAMQIQPDVVCWTSRISGLLICGKFDLGLQALDEMGRLWLTAAKKKYPTLSMDELQKKNQNMRGAVRPTIETINAAVDGLLRPDPPRMDLAHRVLDWASKFGIDPDVITYNTLLRPLARKGHMQEAAAVLQAMQKQGVQADVATFTTLLDETLRSSDQASPEEQKELIGGIFAEMEAAGLKANLHTYGKVIYQILQNVDVDQRLVNAILERMYKQGLKPTTYINTTLLQHYFNRDPPDLDAVRGLIERARLEPGSLDYKFWDRVIEGYSRVGDTASAIRYLSKIKDLGHRVGYPALQMLLLALVKNEEWDVARSFVWDLKEERWAHREPPKDMEKFMRSDEYEFRKLAAELELLETREP